MWLCLVLCTDGVLNVAVFKTPQHFGSFTRNIIHPKLSFLLKLWLCSAVGPLQKN